MQYTIITLMITFLFSTVCMAANPVAIPFKYFVVQNKGRHVMLAATSDDIDFDTVQGAIPNWGHRYRSNNWGAISVISTWYISSLPSHGQLYNAGKMMLSPGVITDPDALYYKPTKGYMGQDSIAYYVVDSRGQSEEATVDFVIASPSNYPMPYGVENPGFGINEEPPADPPGWPSTEVSGFYYWDGTDPHCSDDNDYGYPDVPRCTIDPFGTTIGADKKGVIAPGGEVDFTSYFINIKFEGTLGHEAWLVGEDDVPVKPKIKGNHASAHIRLLGKNYRISGLDFEGLFLRSYGDVDADNSVVRYSDLHDTTDQNGNVMDISSGDHVLDFNVFLYNIGEVDSTLEKERDVHGFDGIAQHNWWVLDCLTSVTAGDSVQITNHNTTENVFVGRLTAHTPMENCIDIKDFNKIVISEIDCWDIRKVKYGNSSGEGQNIYVNDEGVQQNYVYMINNRSWDTNGSTYGLSNIGGTVYLIGNRGFFAPQAYGYTSGTGAGQRILHFNSFENVNRGMEVFNSGIDNHRYITGNYIGKTNEYNSFTMNTSHMAKFDYNFYKEVGPFAWGSDAHPTFGTFEDYKKHTNVELNSLVGINSGMPNIPKHDFSTVSASDLIDAIPSGIIQEYFPGIASLQNDLGVSVKDYTGTERGKNGLYDVGAYEYSSAPQSDGTLAAPRNFMIVN